VWKMAKAAAEEANFEGTPLSDDKDLPLVVLADWRFLMRLPSKEAAT